MSEWRPDLLGEGFECLDLDLGVDDAPASDWTGDEEIPLVATLVRSLPEPLGFWRRIRGHARELEAVDVLYVHGWSDYFFQRRMAEFWTARGARFYALDLRRYGRSLRPGQLHGYVEHLDDYHAEIDMAVQQIVGAGGHKQESSPGSGLRPSDDPPRRLVLFGHSTGGLVLSLWADRNRGIADALVLNSPWLQLQVGDTMRKAIAPVVNLRARLNPLADALPQLDMGFYKRAQAMVADPDEQAAINLDWRPEHPAPVRGGWLKAILEGHARVAAGIDVGAPVCMLLSARSYFGISWRDEMLRADTVLEVEGIARAGLRIGSSLTVERIDGALHDVFLSEESVRTEAYARLDRWTRGWMAATS